MTTLAERIVAIAGTSENITCVSCCATRLRIGLREVSQEIIAELQALDSVRMVFRRDSEVHLIITEDLISTTSHVKTLTGQ